MFNIILIAVAFPFILFFIFYKLTTPSTNQRTVRSAVILEGLKLIQNLTFYKQLDESGKKRLIKDVNKLFLNKEFLNSHQTSLDDEKAYKIALVLALTAFGLETGYHYENLKKIIIYPKKFYSNIVGAEVKGLSHHSGVLQLSWEDFVAGFDTNDDRTNLGLHECAHLLVICKYVKIKQGHWANTAIATITFLKNNPNYQTIFRAYAFSNLDEFWACSVEHFFELPFQFSKIHPQLYHATKEELGF